MEAQVPEASWPSMRAMLRAKVRGKVRRVRARVRVRVTGRPLQYGYTYT